MFASIGTNVKWSAIRQASWIDAQLVASEETYKHFAKLWNMIDIIIPFHFQELQLLN